MLADIGHPFAKGKKVYDVTFENVQAGLRTDYLFRLANQHGGMVVGTGDLSELGLGWCTYGVGDHMSHYNPNGSVSKTLIQHLIRFVAASGDVGKGDGRDPARHPGHRDLARARFRPVRRACVQSTEQLGRPLRAAGLQPLLPDAARLTGRRRSPSWRGTPGTTSKGAWPANLPAGNAPRLYELEEIRHWLALFLRRFFTNQFKRSALPNGPKISSGGSLVAARRLARAVRTASPDVWLAELESRFREGWVCTAALARPAAFSSSEGRIMPDTVDLVRESRLPDHQGTRIRRAGREVRSRLRIERQPTTAWIDVLEDHADNRCAEELGAFVRAPERRGEGRP